jgi:exodeoxyribonuclease VII small subunit
MSEPTPDTAADDIKFEDALARLEAIVVEMESGQLSLEDSMSRFEEGTKLANHCGTLLEATEKKVEVLLRDSEGGQQWREVAGGNAPAQ